jgi:hypothetical protein
VDVFRSGLQKIEEAQKMAITEFCFMSSSASEQDLNQILRFDWLPEWARWGYLVLCVPQGKCCSFFSLILISLINFLY